MGMLIANLFRYFTLSNLIDIVLSIDKIIKSGSGLLEVILFACFTTYLED